MNVNEVRRCLERHGAAMEWIIIVPQDADLPGWQREDKYNVMEADGYIVCSRERLMNIGERHFTDLDAACRYVAPKSRRVAHSERKRREREERRRQAAGD